MKSMTGFGRATHSTESWTASVEVTSINRKQLEIVTNLPKNLTALESNIRQSASPLISRGRVQISIKLDSGESATAPAPRINSQLAKSFDSAFSQLSTILNREIIPSASDFLRQAGIIELSDTETIDIDSAWLAIQPALLSALDNLNTMRSSEGEHLKTDLLTRLKIIETLAATIANHAPSRPEHFRAALTKRLTDLEIPIDLNDERFLREIAIFADRCDISEELTRLSSHFQKFHEYLNAAEPPGRPLDFLCQELFRELNTIASKSNDSLISHSIVEAKSELEKIREQVQNIE